MQLLLRDRRMILGATLVFTGAILFSTKAVLVKLAYRYEVDSISLVLAYIFLGERLGWLQWVGTALVIAGVLVITLQKGPKPAPRLTTTSSAEGPAK